MKVQSTGRVLICSFAWLCLNVGCRSVGTSTPWFAASRSADSPIPAGHGTDATVPSTLAPKSTPPVTATNAMDYAPPASTVATSSSEIITPPILSREPETMLSSNATTSVAVVDNMPIAASDSTASPTRAATEALSLPQSPAGEPTAVTLPLLSALPVTDAAHETVANHSQPPTIELEIANVRVQRGRVKVAVFTDPDKFLNPASATQVLEMNDTSEVATAELKLDRPCAIAVFQDIDGDGRLTTNRMGIPVEPCGFSNNVVIKRGPPKFSDAQVQPGAKVRIQLP